MGAKDSIMVQRMSTKELFAESILELIQTTPLQKITVGAIASNCGMTSRSFYNHFLDKYDLVNWIFINQVEQAYAQLGATLTWKELLIHLIHIMEERKSFYKSVLVDFSVETNFKTEVIERSTDLLLAYVNDNYSAIDDLEELKFQIGTYFYGMMGMMELQLHKNEPMDIDKIADYFTLAMPEILQSYLD